MAINTKYILTAQDRTKAAFSSVKHSMMMTAKAAAFAGTAVAAIGVAAGAVAVRMTKVSMTQADALGKQADKLGLTTEALAALRLAAGHAGVAEESVTKALNKQQKAISDGADGLSTYVRAFDKLGLSAKDLIDLSPDQQLKAISAAMKNVASQTERNAIASDLWGAKNTTMLNLTASGLIAAEERTKALGTALTRIEVSKIEQANDAMRDMKEASNGVANSIAVAVSPLITDLAERFVKASEETGGFRKEILGMARAGVGAIGGLIDAMVFLRRVSLGVKLTIQGVAAAWAFLGSTGPTLFGGAEYKAQQQANLDEALSAIEQTKTALIDLANLPSYKDVTLEWFDEVQAASEKTAEKLIKERKELNAVLEKPLPELEYINIAKIHAQLIKVEDDTKEVTESMNQFAIQAGRNIQDSLAQFLFDPMEDGFKGMVKGFANALRQMAAQAAASWVLTQMFGGTAVGAYLGIGGKALGGSVSSGTPYIVGEKGPELFVPGKSGTIVPNNKLGGGGATIIQHNNIDARGATQDVIKMLPGILAQNRAAAVADMRELVRRGGL